jgi:hypothetical protein
MSDLFDFDVMAFAYLLVLAANLALILLIGNLTYERARDAWTSVSGRARSLQSGLTDLRAATETAERQTVEASHNIEAARRKLADTEAELEELRRRHESEPLPFVYRVTPTENFDPGGTVWEFVVQHDGEGQQEADPHHPARQWVGGRYYLIQAATQKAAHRQLERHVPEAAGFRITLVRNHDAGYAKAG